MKLISHLLIFIIGAGAGVMWGVRHPSEAQNVDAKIQAEVSKAKIEVLNRVAAENPKSSAAYQQMAQEEQHKLDDANNQLAKQ